jgi:sugar transferase (PEP-CTERM/EpsH1 system associated)
MKVNVGSVEQPRQGMTASLGSLEASRPNLLYLVHRVPYPPDKGDRIRNYHILRYLAERARVHLACLADEPVPASVVQALQRSCQRLAVVPLGKTRWLRATAALLRGRSITAGAFQAPALRKVLSAWAGNTNFDVALASSSGMVPYLQQPELRSVPAVIDLIDVDSQKWFDYAASARGWRPLLYRLEGRRLRRLEQGLTKWARAVTVVSKAEADLYRSFSEGGRVCDVHNGVDLDYFQPAAPADAPVCAFVGALDYRPNVDAVTWFCKEVWPAFHLRRPEARFLVIGRRPVPEVVGATAAPGVELVPDVPDVRPHLARASVAVVPLRIARGVQNKVLEALAMSKAVVAAPAALAGLETTPGVHLLSATSPTEWLDTMDRVLNDGALRERLGRAGRLYVEEHHHWQRCLAPLGGLLGLAETP